MRPKNRLKLKERRKAYRALLWLYCRFPHRRYPGPAFSKHHKPSKHVIGTLSFQMRHLDDMLVDSCVRNSQLKSVSRDRIFQPNGFQCPMLRGSFLPSVSSPSIHIAFLGRLTGSDICSEIYKALYSTSICLV